MNISKISTSVIKTAGKAIQKHNGKKNVPRFLYHITSPEAYDKIIKAGHLEVSKDSLTSLDGVFMFDLKNVLRRWKSPDGTCNIGLGLLGLGVKDGTKAVVLRIPTENLQKESLKVRSLNRCMSDKSDDVFHSQYGDSAGRFKHYTEKKEAVEFIYLDKIRVSKDNCIGPADIGKDEQELFKLVQQDVKTQNDFFALKMKELFKSTSEEKAIDILL